MDYTQKGGLKNLLKLKKDDIARLFIAELNRAKSLNSTFQATSSKEAFSIVKNTENGNSLIHHYTPNLFDTFNKLPNATNTNNNTVDLTLTDNIISVSPTQVAHKSDVLLRRENNIRQQFIIIIKLNMLLMTR